MIFHKHANIKYKFGNRHFWAEGYYGSTVGRNKETMKKYIQDQQEEDMLSDQITLKEYIDPFKGQYVITALMIGVAGNALCNWQNQDESLDSVGLLPL